MLLRLRNNVHRRAQTRLSRSVLLPRKILSVNRSKDGLANSACPAPWLLDGALSYSSSCFHWLQDFPSFYLHPMKQHCKTPHQIPHYLHHFFSPRLLLSPGYKRSVMRENSTSPAFLLTIIMALSILYHTTVEYQASSRALPRADASFCFPRPFSTPVAYLPH